MTGTPTTTPRIEDFRALAQSSPWRFTTVHFTHLSDRAVDRRASLKVEAWLDRAAGRLTVRSLAGVEVCEGVPYGVSYAVAHTGADSHLAHATDGDSRLPRLRPDGLVAERPDDWHLHHGDPMWRDYQWTAMLDPAELHDGVEIHDVHATTLRGRVTWSAVCRPLIGEGEDWVGGYDPRCGCCPLLDSAASRLVEYGPDDPSLLGEDLPTAYRVQLDVQTAIAVEIEALDGRGGLVLRNEILSVDQLLQPPGPA